MLINLSISQRRVQKQTPRQNHRRNNRHRLRLGPPQQPKSLETTHHSSKALRNHLRRRKHPPTLLRASSSSNVDTRTHNNNPPHLYLRWRNAHFHQNRTRLLPRSYRIPSLQSQKSHLHRCHRPDPSAPPRAKRSPGAEPQLPNKRP